MHNYELNNKIIELVHYYLENIHYLCIIKCMNQVFVTLY
ncbi:hypothetical protein SAMN05216463_12176 [Xylanibacter ruminicola]|uniref:Uncharacterized protein n=1 Tax=Xylanibacter ruminicola TaxID=839 RepID=A0A1M6XQP3_XYLRU|nr:hypothetical protein SAMN05216463_12176 [Xylanibacter ruminicola]